MSKAIEEQIEQQSLRIKTFTTEYPIEVIVNKYDNGTIHVPKYQRNLKWNKNKQSRFIESIFMGLPIPYLFFFQDEEGKLEIVDGSQRIRTIHRYVKDELQLGSLDVIGNLSGTKFSDLTKARQQIFLNQSLLGVVLDRGVGPDTRFEMFDRINTGSEIANMAEIRHGALAGKFMDLIIDNAANEKLKELAPLSEGRESGREYEELVSRFYAYSEGIGPDYRDEPAKYIYNFIKGKNLEYDSNQSALDGLKAEFETMLAFVEKQFPYGFKKTLSGSFTPRGRFEAIAIGSHLALEQKPELADAQPHSLGVEEWIGKAEFQEATSANAANNRSRLENRIYFVRDKLLNHGN